MTYEELIAHCKDGDPLITSENYSVTEEFGLYIPGTCTEGYTMDIRIKIVGDKLHCSLRDPDDCPDGEGLFGKTWDGENAALQIFSRYEDLVTWVYEW